MSENNAIFVNVSNEYFKYFYVFNKSLQKNFPNYPALIVLWQNLTDTQLKFLNSISRVQSWDIDSIDFQGGPAMLGREREDPKIYYARYLIFSGLLNQYDKILYLDTDVVILNPLDDLFAKTEFTIFKEAYRGENPVIRTNIETNKLVELCNEDQLPDLPDVAANAGIFLATEQIRTTDNFQHLMSIKERYRDYLIWGDQSAMNLWMLSQGLSSTDDYRYNFQPLLFDQKREWDAFKDVRIFHFNGMVNTGQLTLLMNMCLLSWKVPLAGRWIYYLFHRLFFSQYTQRFPKLKGFLNWLSRRFRSL